jgi:hypothetical protein
MECITLDLLLQLTEIPREIQRCSESYSCEAGASRRGVLGSVGPRSENTSFWASCWSLISRESARTYGRGYYRVFGKRLTALCASTVKGYQRVPKLNSRAAKATERFRLDVAICRRGRDHDRHVGYDRGSRGLDHDPCGDRAQHGRGLLPNTPHRNVRRRGAV